MHGVLRVTSILFALSLMLAACADATTQTASQAVMPVIGPTASHALSDISTATGVSSTVTPVTASPTLTSVPISTPQPTSEPILAQDVRVAGVNVSKMSLENARRKIADALSPMVRALEVQAGDVKTTVEPEEIDLQLPLDDLLMKAQMAGAGARVGLEVRYDQGKLRAVLEKLAQKVEHPAYLSVITDTETISRSFVIEPGAQLDIDAALKRVDEELHTSTVPHQVTLELTPVPGDLRPTQEQLQQQLESMAAEWGKGVAGVYVYDLKSEQVSAEVNKDTVFSAASSIKTAILLNTYINLSKFTRQQENALQKMIIDSDNLAANAVLAASVGGIGTEDALAGAEQMSALLSNIGLPHTYLYIPFEASDYINLRHLKIKTGPKQEGPPPYANSGQYLRSTPAEMSQIYIYIEQCANGKGPLLKQFERLSAARCQEMIRRLEDNGDTTRMVAGFPSGVRVAHKSGWMDDTQSDAGIVRAPGGDFVLAIYLYRPLLPKRASPDSLFRETIAGFSHLVYSYYNPFHK